MSTLTLQQPAGKPRSPAQWLSYHGLLVAAACGLTAAAVTTQGFMSVDNLKAILASMGILGVVALGMTCITLVGALFSLSLGTTVVISAMLFLSLLDHGPAVAMLITLVVGVAICSLQGWIIGGIGANPIILTVAAGGIQLGVAQRLSDGSAIYPPDEASFRFLADTVAGIPVSVFAMVLTALLLQAALSWSRNGHLVKLVGENRRAAHAAGLPVAWVTTFAFALAGASAALAGVLAGGVQGNATLLSGDIYTYDAIAAVLVGGTAIAGGMGSMARTILGALLIAVVSNVLLLRGYSLGIQILVRGIVVLVVIVAVQSRARARS